MARATDYNQKTHDHIVWALAVEGKTDKQIACILGITERTLNRWKKNYASFCQSLKEGKQVADVEVTKSLYERATGKTVIKHKKVIVEMNKDGTQRPARVETTEDSLPADTTAAIFWLKNRRPDLWRDRQDVKIDNDEWVTALQSVVDGYKKENGNDGAKAAVNK